MMLSSRAWAGLGELPITLKQVKPSFAIQTAQPSQLRLPPLPPFFLPVASFT
jgi:hypothetical protein